MSLASLIATHGYWILAAGCFLEGETALLLAGFAARQGYLEPAAVFGIASACAFASTQLSFWLGRRHGAALVGRWPSLAQRAASIAGLIERYPSAAAFAVRFAYGARIAGPILIGTSSIPQARFTMLNALSAIVWASVVESAGWLFGAAAEHALGNIAHVELWAFAAIVASVLAWRLMARR